ncbi:hypothetical protein AMTRI_Chr08g207880 [Amborella trichopoda]
MKITSFACNVLLANIQSLQTIVPIVLRKHMLTNIRSNQEFYPFELSSGSMLVPILLITRLALLLSPSFNLFQEIYLSLLFNNRPVSSNAKGFWKTRNYHTCAI